MVKNSIYLFIMEDESINMYAQWKYEQKQSELM